MKKTNGYDKKLKIEFENNDFENRVGGETRKSEKTNANFVEGNSVGNGVGGGEEKNDANGAKGKNDANVKKDSKKDTMKSKILLMISGVATGFANGFFGGGGGMITVPVLSKLLKYEEKKAHATALLVILPISIFSSISYVVKGSIDWKTAGFVAIGVITGGIIGAVFLKKISNKVLTYLFAVIMIAVGVKMFL